MTLPDTIALLQSRLLTLADPDDVPRGAGARSAAVLMLLFPRHGEIHVVLTVRPHSLRRHPGQISLPGGRIETGDLTLWHTAVRETREELGVASDSLVPLGRLKTFHLHVSNYAIAPFVCWHASEPTFVPDPDEVAEVIEVPLSVLLSPQSVEVEIWELHGQSWRVAFYRVGDHRIWGATARILFDLACLLDSDAAAVVTPPGSVQPTGSDD